jgi:diphthine-ammonia ligase
VSAVCSWSGGKDSALALQLATDSGAQPSVLLTMLTEDGERSRSHGLPRAVLEAQADALGLPLVVAAATWDAYTDTFVETLRTLQVAEGIFGDIDIDEHRLWVERTCAAAGVVVRHPLWQRPRRDLLAELQARGFRATIVAVRDGVLDPVLLGRELDEQLADEIEAAGADACGEGGEYHTVVTDGPGFAAQLELVHGERVLRSGCWFLDVALR